MASVIPSPSPSYSAQSQKQKQQQPQPTSLHHKRSSAALHHHRPHLSTSSFMSTSTSTSSIHSLAASPSKPLARPGVPVRRQLHFGLVSRKPEGSRRRSSSSSSSSDGLSPRMLDRRSSAARRMESYRLDTSLPPSRIPVLSPSYRSPSQQHRPAWGASPTKRSISFSFNRPPPQASRSIAIHSPPSPRAFTDDLSMLSPSPAMEDPPISPDSPSPHNSILPPLLHSLEAGRKASTSSVTNTRRKTSDVLLSPSTLSSASPFVGRESRTAELKLSSPFRSLSESRARLVHQKNTPPPHFSLPQPQSQPPRPQPLQRIRNSFPSSTSLSSTANPISPAGSVDSRASSSKLAFEDARPSPEAFRVSLMKKGGGTMHGLPRGTGLGESSRAVYQAPPTPNPKLHHLQREHQHCAERSPMSTVSRSGRSFLSHSLSCRQMQPSALSQTQPLAASWSAGSESSNAASANSPAISPRHKGADRFNITSVSVQAPPSSLSAPSMAKIQAQSDFLHAIDSAMTESPERVNGVGLGLGGLGIGFAGFGRGSVDPSGPPKTSRFRTRRSGIKRKGSHLDAPSIPVTATFDVAPSSPPSFSVGRQGGRPPLKRASYAEDVFGSKFEVLGEVGRGMSGGIVYKALEKANGIVAAVKVSPVYGGVRDRIRHLEEVDILRTITKAPHSNVISLLSSWEQAGRLHIHTPLALGGDLSTFLSLLAQTPSDPSFASRLCETSPPGLDEARTWKLLASLSSGLAHIHSLGIIHLDIKPANVLISHEGNVVLTDFGTATCWPRKRPSEILNGSGHGSGKVEEISSGPVWEEREGDRGYLSAEAVNGTVSMAGDVFSLGLLMLEALTNIIPPSNGDAWTRLRSDDFTDIEAPPPSPAASTCSTLRSPTESSFSTRSSSGYLGVNSPATESDTSLLTPSVGGGLSSPCAPIAWGSDALTSLIKSMMASDPARRPSASDIKSHLVISRVHQLMASKSAPNARPALIEEPSLFLSLILDGAGRPSHHVFGDTLRPYLPSSSYFAKNPSKIVKDPMPDLALDLEKMDVDIA